MAALFDGLMLRIIFLMFFIFSRCSIVYGWDSVDLELFDLVEEIKDNFYDILGLKQLVAVSEVLKDEEKRKRYDGILRDGLPDWRQPVFYYRSVRKMGLIEFTILLFLILTIGHYIVAWSIYLEKKLELEELLFSKKKREDKKRNKKLKSKLNDEDIPDLADIMEKPSRPRRRQRVNIPQEDTEDNSWEGAPVTNVLKMATDNGDHSAVTEKSGEWTDHEQSLLTRAMVKFPGGTPNRWEKIAVEIGRSVEEVTKQMKKLKQSYGAPTHSSNAGEGDLSTLVINKKKAMVSDECLEQADECYNFGSNSNRHRNKSSRSQQTTKNVADRPVSEVSVPSVLRDRTSEQSDGVTKKNVTDDDSTAWSQNQQKQLEIALQKFPKTVADRWTCIAQAVPGKTKEECILRYKFLVECVRKKKLAGQQQ
ncbi:hypothetical protein pdam_00018594 [Pocillopora damicornis]|uniref:DnaJ homolog subfamily C member 1 n=1 Tax=Pocillopora damicornis TaxID=46731 RepID=A0A3M6UML0_POCDA|nr:hypothetical protein pdam_00018594 [Pocillopora damicornis]